MVAEVAPASSTIFSMAASIAPVVSPGTTIGAIRSRISAAIRPAACMPAKSSGW
jgi:hypothetical protein